MLFSLSAKSAVQLNEPRHGCQNSYEASEVRCNGKAPQIESCVSAFNRSPRGTFYYYFSLPFSPGGCFATEAAFFGRRSANGFLYCRAIMVGLGLAFTTSLANRASVPESFGNATGEVSCTANC